MVNLANGLVSRGLSVDLVLIRSEGPYLAEIDKSVRLVELGTSSYARAMSLVSVRPSDLLGLAHLLIVPHSPKPLSAVPNLAKYLRREQPIAMLSALAYGNIASIIAAKIAATDTRVVISQRNHLSAQSGHYSPWRARQTAPAFRRFYSHADRIIAVSRGVAEDLAKAIDIPDSKITTIYNAVASAALDAKAAEPIDHPWFGPERPPVLLAAGRLLCQKDFPTLIKAFSAVRRTRDARLIILGEGPERGRLQSLACELGVASDVALLGFVDNPFAYMARANVFVLSSVYEGLPGVLIQALACGCPVVSTDCPSGPSEILEKGRYGQLTPVGDFQSMAEAIHSTLDAPPERDFLKQRGGHFSTERAVDAYLDVLLG